MLQVSGCSDSLFYETRYKLKGDDNVGLNEKEEICWLIWGELLLLFKIVWQRMVCGQAEVQGGEGEE